MINEANKYIGMLIFFLIQTFKRAEFTCHSCVNILQVFKSISKFEPRVIILPNYSSS